MVKSYGWLGGWWVAYSILVSAQGPSVLGFWVWGLRVWGQGLTTINHVPNEFSVLHFVCSILHFSISLLTHNVLVLT